MPRNHPPPKEKAYDSTQIPDFIQRVADGESIYQVAKAEKIPKETLRRWVNSPPQRVGSGRSTTLTDEEELEIVAAVKFMAKCGLPVDRRDIQSIVQNYMRTVGRPNPFLNDKPGIDWLQGFEKRHPDLSRRKSELLTTARARGLSPEVVSAFFDKYEKLLDDNDLNDKPECIFNLDETGFNTDLRAGKVYTQTAAANVYQKSPTCGKSSFTVLFCVSASGVFLPPFVVYKGLHLYSTWMKGGPPGTTYGCTPSGWMTDTIFESWFTKVFIPKVEPLSKPVLLTYDGHNSHLTYATVKAAIENNIIILCLPPNTSHALQPLDVAVFSPMKVAWRQVLRKWSRESRLKNVDKSVFPYLLTNLWAYVNEEHAIAGFRGSGLYPVDRQAVCHRIVVSETDASDGNQLHEAILKTLIPQTSTATENALVNAKRKRKRVQSVDGEVLTEPEAANRLLREKEERERQTEQKNSNQRKKLKQVKELKPLNCSEQSSNSSKVKRPSTSRVIPNDDKSCSDSSSDNDDPEPLKLRVLRNELSNSMKSAISLQRYVIVVYDDEPYPGIVVDLREHEVEVKTMERSGQNWKWPAKDDILPYRHSDVLGAIAPPQQLSSRGTGIYKVCELSNYY